VVGLTDLLRATSVLPGGETTQLTLGGGAAEQLQPLTRQGDMGQMARSGKAGAPKGGARGSADRKVEAAMHAIMDWNQNQHRHEQKFAISQSLLQKCTGSNMPAVRRVMMAFKAEIAEHHANHSLDPERHNFHMDFRQIQNVVSKMIERS
jgi:hypothetical protein